MPPGWPGAGHAPGDSVRWGEGEREAPAPTEKWGSRVSPSAEDRGQAGAVASLKWHLWI